MMPGILLRDKAKGIAALYRFSNTAGKVGTQDFPVWRQP